MLLLGLKWMLCWFCASGCVCHIVGSRSCHTILLLQNLFHRLLSKIKNCYSLGDQHVLFFVEPAYLVVLCEEELVVIDLLTKETGYVLLVIMCLS